MIEKFNKIIKKTTRKYVILGCLGVLLMVTGCGGGSESQTADIETPAETAQETVPEVKVMAFGQVISPRHRNITIGFSSRVEKLNFSKGDLISEGDIIAELDISNHLNQIAVTEQNLKKAKLQLTQLEQDYEKSGKRINEEYQSVSTTLETTKKELEHLTNELKRKKRLFNDKSGPSYLKLVSERDRAKEELILAEENYTKNKTLFQNDAISEESLNQSANQVEQAQNRVYNSELAIESYLTSAQSELDQLEVQITSKEGSVKNSEMRLENMSSPEITALEIQKTQIQLQEKELQQLKEKLDAPYIKNGDLVADFKKGILYEYFCTDGDMLSSGQKVFTIMDADSLLVRAHIPEEFIKDVQIGDEASIIPMSDPNKTYSGRISKIAAMADQKNGETVVTVTIDIQDNDGFLLPNFNVDVEIIGTPEKETANG